MGWREGLSEGELCMDFAGTTVAQLSDGDRASKSSWCVTVEVEVALAMASMADIPRRRPAHHGSLAERNQSSVVNRMLHFKAATEAN